jgi:hypothetical protein
MARLEDELAWLSVGRHTAHSRTRQRCCSAATKPDAGLIALARSQMRSIGVSASTSQANYWETLA